MATELKSPSRIPKMHNNEPEASYSRFHKFLTNDVIQITGAFAVKRGHELWVNETPVGMDRREHMLMWILGNYSKTRREFSDSEYMSVETILEQIELLKKQHPTLNGLWATAIYLDVYSVIGKLRMKLAKNRFNKFLIESGPGGQGYRLSTKPQNITIKL